MADLLILTREEVEELLDPDELRKAVALALTDLSAGRSSMPPRVVVDVPERGAFLALMPALVPSMSVLTTKLITAFPRNVDRPTHHAIVVVFDPMTGSPVALMDGQAITARRTAAGSALSTELLAREDAAVLAVLGTGVQARAHVQAVTRVRAFSEVRIAGRDAAKARALATELGATACDTFEDAMRGADVVCACTHSAEPVVLRRQLTDGAHVASVGYNRAGREVDADTIRDALVVVESRETVLSPPPVGSNDLLWAIRDGVIRADHVQYELGELVSGARVGRSHPGQLTLYKSVGVAVEDAAAAALVLREANRRNAGTQVTL